MKTVLLLPPPCYPFIPEAGAAYVAAFLRSRDLEVDLLNLGIRAFERMANRCETNAERFRSVFSAVEDYRVACRDFFHHIDRTNELFPPLGLGLGGASKRADLDAHPLVRVSRDLLQAEAIGSYQTFLFSVSHPAQFPVSLALARFIKQQDPAARIIFGGAAIAVVMDSLSQGLYTDHYTKAFEAVDFMVSRLGEATLEHLLENVEKAPTRGRVSYLQDGKICHCANYQEPALDALPTPDYSGYELDRYLTPQPIVSLRSSARCYWGKCRFCRGASDLFAERKTARSAAKLLEDIQTLQRGGIERFLFAEDASHPETFTALAHLLLDHSLDVHWGTVGIRFEASITEQDIALWAAAGCKHLALGLESGSERLLRELGKGISLDHVERVLTWCTAHGISTYIYCFVGYPSETLDEARSTVSFLERNQERITAKSVGWYFSTPQQPDFDPATKDQIVGEEPEGPEILVPRPSRFLSDPKLAQLIKAAAVSRATDFFAYAGYHLALPRRFFRQI